MYLGSFGIDEYVGIPAATHRFSSGAAYVASVLTYSIYEEETAVGLDEDVDMTPATPFDSIVGCYWVRRQLTTAAGFEAGKNYLVVVKATVDSVAAITMHTFQMRVPQTGDAYARLGAPAGASVSADIAAIEAQTDDIGAAGAGLTALATAAELLKVPKSDSTVSFNATALAAIADAVADEAYDGTVTLRQSVRGLNSASLGKLSGAATTTVAVRDLADSKDRITATVDASGNRSAISTDLS